MLHSVRVVKKAERASQEFTAECLAGLRRAQALRPADHRARRAPSTERSCRYNQLLTAASASNALAGLMSEVHPDEAIRDAARECEQEVSRFYSDLALDREMYDALAAVDVGGADADTQRFVAHTLRDYRRAGVDKPPEVRARLKQIDEELTKLGQQFSKNISEDVRAIEVDDPARLAGLPADFIAAHPPDAERHDPHHDRLPRLQPVHDVRGRRRAPPRALRRVPQPRRSAERGRAARHPRSCAPRRRRCSGSRDWADYITADKMIGSGERAARVHREGLEARRAARRAGLRGAAAPAPRRSSPKATAVADWQKVWLENLVKKERYEVDASEVRQYFPYERVLAGLLEITPEIFDLDVRRRWRTPRAGTRASSSTT